MSRRVGRLQGRAPSVYWLLLLPSLANLVLIVSVAALVGKRPDDGLTWSTDGRIFEMAPDGPAAGAGLRIGDTVVELERLPVLTAVSLYEGKSPGDQVLFTVRRNDRLYDIPVTLKSPSPVTVLNQLAPLIVAFSFWLVS